LDRKEVEDTRYFSGSFISIPFFCTRLIHVTIFFTLTPLLCKLVECSCVATVHYIF
jgi:hypothetical protein